MRTNRPSTKAMTVMVTSTACSAASATRRAAGASDPTYERGSRSGRGSSEPRFVVDAVEPAAILREREHLHAPCHPCAVRGQVAQPQRSDERSSAVGESVLARAEDLADLGRQEAARDAQVGVVLSILIRTD